MKFTRDYWDRIKCVMSYVNVDYAAQEVEDEEPKESAQIIDFAAYKAARGSQ